MVSLETGSNAHIGDSVADATGSISPEKVKCPPINASAISRSNHFSIAPKSYRESSSNKKDFLTTNTMQSIE